MKRPYVNEPHVGQRYRTIDNTKEILMEIIDLTEPNGDPWVEFKNVVSKQTYSCRLDAFLARYSPIVS